MKSTLLLLPIVCAGLTSFGAADEPGLYFKTEAGPAFLQTLRADYGTGHFDLSSDVGTRVDLTVGYRFTSFLAGELNGGMVWNKLLDVAQHDFYQVPIMANVVWKPEYDRLAPFAGVGAGGVDLIIVPHGFGNGQTESHFVFGAQAFAGLGYRLTRACELGLSYRFMGAASERFQNGNGFIRVGPAFTHTILAEFTFAF
ncbi:MAG TPA: outer membrane beta-barrel protein [Patescibacteria group bacterium]|nr:outer membrane beta-barrel protein [Patescibacteria group bacterium]